MESGGLPRYFAMYSLSAYREREREREMDDLTKIEIIFHMNRSFGCFDGDNNNLHIDRLVYVNFTVVNCTLYSVQCTEYIESATKNSATLSLL